MTVDQLSSTFAALADPTRREILARLAGGRGRRQRARRAVLDQRPGAVDWLEEYRRFWEGSFDHLEARLCASEKEPLQ